MTQMEVTYRYNATPGEAAFRAIDSVSEVYGIRKISFNQNDRTVRVEFDASRLKEPMIAGLLRESGIDIGERLIPA